MANRDKRHHDLPDQGARRHGLRDPGDPGHRRGAAPQRRRRRPSCASTSRGRARATSGPPSSGSSTATSTWSSTPRTAPPAAARPASTATRSARRRCMANIPCITTVQGLGAAVQGIEASIRGDDRGAVAAGLVPLRRAGDGYDALFDHGFAGSTPRRRTGSGFRAVRAARPVLARRRRRGAPVTGDGADLPQRARAGRRLRQERRRHRRAGARWASGTSRSAPSPAEPQPGNAKPRLFRLTADRAVVNRMGFNNDGAEVVAATARRSEVAARPRRSGARRQHRQDQGRARGRRGRGRATTRSQRPAARSARRLPGGQRQLAQHARPAQPAGGREARAAARARCSGTAGDLGARCWSRSRRTWPTRTSSPWPTWPPRSGSTGSSRPTPRSPATAWPSHRRRSRRSARAGCPAGRSPTARLDVLRLLRDRVGDGLTLIGVGGITTVEDARARLDAGADLLQGYTAFIYEGPRWPRRIVKGVSMTLRATLRGSARGPRTVLRRHRPALRPARRVGAARRRRRAGAVRARPRSRGWRRTSRWSSRSRRSTSGSAAVASPCWSG